MVFPLHFTRRMIWTPFLASSQAQLCEKCDHLRDSDKKLSAISLLLKIFRRLNAITIAFHAPNDTHAIFSVETSPIVRKMRTHTRFWSKLSVISLLLEIFRRLNGISTAFYTPNAIHPSFIVEWSTPVRKMRPFTRLWRKLIVISLLLKIFHRLNAASIAFYTPNAMHAVFSVETSPIVHKIRPFMRFWRETERYFAIVRDISLFIRFFHGILLSEWYASRF